MNKFIKEQLNKCEKAHLPPYDDNTLEVIIPKRNKMINTDSTSDLELHHYYKIQVETYIIKPFPGFNLHDNWNNGIAPTDIYMNVEIIQIMGKMIKINAVGVNDGKSWVGWLPRKSITIIQELV